jgi:hypothetical protein
LSRPSADHQADLAILIWPLGAGRRGSSRCHAGREQVAAPLLTSPHGGGRHQLGSQNRTSPAATSPRWCSSAGRWRLTRATKRSPGSSRSSSADSRAKVARVEAGDGQKPADENLAGPHGRPCKP